MAARLPKVAVFIFKDGYGEWCVTVRGSRAPAKRFKTQTEAEAHAEKKAATLGLGQYVTLK